MFSLDISTSLDPVINLSGVSTAIAIARASTCEKVTITLSEYVPIGKVTISVRIIEGMETITARGTVSKNQYSLISALVDLMQDSRMLRV